MSPWELLGLRPISCWKQIHGPRFRGAKPWAVLHTGMGRAAWSALETQRHGGAPAQASVMSP